MDQATWLFMLMLMSLVESDVYTPTVVGGATSAKSTGLWEVK